jgi:hypothetical protein
VRLANLIGCLVRLLLALVPHLGLLGVLLGMMPRRGVMVSLVCLGRTRRTDSVL